MLTERPLQTSRGQTNTPTKWATPPTELPGSRRGLRTSTRGTEGARWRQQGAWRRRLPAGGPPLPFCHTTAGPVGGTGIQVRPVASWDAGQGVQLLQIQRTPGSPGSARARAASSPKAGGGPGRGQLSSPPPHTHGQLASCLLLKTDGQEAAFCIPAFKTGTRDSKQRHTRRV